MRTGLIPGILLAFILFSCAKGGDSVSSPPGPDPVDTSSTPIQPVKNKIVYTAGIVNGAAVYWKDKKETILWRANTIDAKAWSLAVSGNDVYVAGYIVDSAVVWKNNVRQSLPAQLANAKAIVVNNNDVYVGGSHNTNIGSKAVIWKNGIEQELISSNDLASISGMTMSGSDLYAVGFAAHDAVYWKNGVKTFLGDGTIPGPGTFYHRFATAIAVSGQDVYIAGHSGTSAVYWKNGNMITLATGVANAEGIAVLNNDVYVVGDVDGIACYWKNGVKTTIGPLNGLSRAYGLYVSGQDIYMSGYWGSSAAYWKNGQPTLLSTGVSNSDIAFSIVVVEQ